MPLDQRILKLPHQQIYKITASIANLPNIRSSEMNSRREFLKRLSVSTGVGLAATTGLYSLDSLSASLSGYKALIVVHLNGGNDSNDFLVPMDGAFSDYEKARPSIALKKDMLQSISGNYLGHSLGINKAAAPLLDIFNSGHRRVLAFN